MHAFQYIDQSAAMRIHQTDSYNIGLVFQIDLFGKFEFDASFNGNDAKYFCPML